MLIKLRGGFWITDPVFAERASPVQWMGPKRFHAPPIALEDLPPLRGVILSHDHYDHLDRATVLQLAKTTGVFLTPLGVGDRLIAWGVDAAKVRQFDWWQGTTIDGVQFTATPAQHFSGRGLFDGNKTLWASWVIVDGATATLRGRRAAAVLQRRHRLLRRLQGDRPPLRALRRDHARDRRLRRAMAVRTHAARADRAGAPGSARSLAAAGAQRHLRLGHARLAGALRARAGAERARDIALTTPRMGERLDLSTPHAAHALVA